MKAFLIVVAILLLMVLIGWLSFGLSDNTAAVRLNTEKIEQDTSEAVEKGKNLVNEAEEEIREEQREERIEDAGELSDEPVTVP